MSIILGLIAAIAWGFHDLCVRYVSQATGIFASLITVLAIGSILVLPISVYAWDTIPTNQSLLLGVLAGLLFGIAGIAHYKAFSIGPVRLVAPVIAAYPVFSIGLAVWQGTPVSILQWMAVMMIVAGVGYVAASGDKESVQEPPHKAIFWSILAAVGFALTFAVGQAASQQGGELALLFPTRIAALFMVFVIALMIRVPILPGFGQLKILGAMGLLDAIAIGSVLSAGRFPNPELASVLSATFGLITILLAALFLKERISGTQWIAVTAVFASICYLAL